LRKEQSVAKYVLIEFDNDQDADKLIGAIDIWSSRLSEMLHEELEEPKVIAEFKKPTQFCEHTHNDRLRQRKGMETGQRFGWLVCGICKKPTRGGGQIIFNLLEAEKKPWNKIFKLHVRCEYMGVEPKGNRRL
jgi:23S rRNA C2498 (ribose-2'-O)-methylase RlmM